MNATDRAALTRLAGYPTQARKVCADAVERGQPNPEIEIISHMALADQTGSLQDLHAATSELLASGYRSARTCAFHARCCPTYVPEETARQHLIEAEQKAKDAPVLLAEIATSYIALNQHGQALFLLERANQLAGASGTLSSLLSLCQLHVGAYGQALASARIAWKENPDTYHAAKALLPAALAEKSQPDAQLCLDWMSRQKAEVSARVITEWSEILEHMRHFVSAAIVYRPLMEANKTSFPHVGRYGELLLKAYRPDEAEPYLLKAADLKPGHEGVHTALARCYIQLGNLPKARDSLMKSIDLCPKQINAYAILSEIDAKALTSGHLDDLSHAIDAGIADVETRAAGMLALARSKEVSKDYPAAFQYFSDANKIFDQHYQSLGLGYDKAAIEDEFAATKEIFSTRNMQSYQRSGVSLSDYIFILGMPRSGTTLCEQILSAHPEITGMGERGVIGNFWRTLYQEWQQGTDVRDFLATSVGTWAEKYEAAMAGSSETATVYIDKAPLNFRYIGLISLVLPGAKIIYAQRDPVDTCLSIFRLRFPHSFTFANSLENLAHYYGCHLDLMNHWRQSTPLEMTQYNYETLVTDTESEARRLVAFAEQNWDPACLNFHTSGRPVYTLSGSQVRKPIYHSAVKRWQHYENLLPEVLLQLASSRSQENSVPTA